TETIRIRMSLGFPDDGALKGHTIPANVGATFLTIPSAAEAECIQRISPTDRNFLDKIGCDCDLLAFPLFGGQTIAEHPSYGSPQQNREAVIGPHRIGALYVARRIDAAAREELALLRGLADRVGLILSVAKEHDRLTTTIQRLEREREW